MTDRYGVAVVTVLVGLMSIGLSARAALSVQSLALVSEVPSEARDLFENLPPEEAPDAVAELMGAIESSDKRRSQKSHLKAVLVTFMWMGMRERHDIDAVGGILALTSTRLALPDLAIMTAALMLAAGPEGAAIYDRIKDELDTLPAATRDAAQKVALRAAEAPGIYVRPRTMEALLAISGRLLPSEPLRQPVLPVIITGGNPSSASTGGGPNSGAAAGEVPDVPPPPPRPYPGQR